MDYQKIVNLSGQQDPQQQTQDQQAKQPETKGPTEAEILSQNKWLHDPVTIDKLKKVDAILHDLQQHSIAAAMTKDGDVLAAKQICMYHVVNILKGVLTNP